MNKEFASGAILFRTERDQVLYLLIYSRRNRIWGFAKGHIERGEDEMTAARREILEETGIRDLAFVDGFRKEDVYPAVSNQGPFKGQTIEKHSIYYLARVKTPAVTVDQNEISDYRWLPFPDAQVLLPFKDMKSILAQAHDFLIKKS
jgi:8-oxo-dGTP pyrophosphatase MutT (NUDIX family)